jgi:hypothetical protein
VDKHHIERALQPDGAHIARLVFAVGVQVAAEGQHMRGQIDQGDGGEGGFHVQRVVAAAAAQLQQGRRRVSGLFGQQMQEEGGLFSGFSRVRDQRPPYGQFGVEFVHRWFLSPHLRQPGRRWHGRDAGRECLVPRLDIFRRSSLQ